MPKPLPLPIERTQEELREEYFRETQVEEFQSMSDRLISAPISETEFERAPPKQDEKPRETEPESAPPEKRFDDDELSFVRDTKPITKIEEDWSEKIQVEKPVEPEKKSFFEKLTEKVVKKVTEKKLTREDVDPILSDMETSLIESDVAVEVAEKIKGDLASALVDRDIKRGKERDVIIDAFRNSMMEILDVPKIDLSYVASQKKPVVIAFWGFNGVGKTTSLAKMASWLMGKGHTCVFAAADTFRAGAEEQLEIHANRLGVKLVKHNYGADPAAVIFDAVEHAKAKGIDFVLADTAGRTHTNANLMDQMRKIVRVNKPDIKILVIDSLIGNDAVIQANMYNEVGVDALIFTKVDVNEKGGAILSVTHQLKKPIIFLGLGQDYSHFEEFDAKKFVDKILE